MKTNVKLLTALLAMALVSVSAYAQQTARRDSDVNRRKEVKVERQQNKVDKGQTITNISNQNNTDKKVRESQGSNRPSGGSGSLNGGNHGSVNANSGSHGHGNGNAGNGNHGSVNNGSNSSGSNNHGNVNGGNHGSGNHHVEHHDGRHEEHARRPSMAPVIKYNRIQVYERTNASSIVVSTNFRSKREAYDYIEWLLAEKTYAVFSYGNNYNWLQTEVAFIPTPFDWTNPMTHNQFRIKFNISQSLFGVIRVTITAEWRESYLSDSYSRLRFQPSNSYSTYYAWNVLEAFASSIPHNVIAYR